MPHVFLERKEVVNKMTYHTQDPTATVFSSVKELIEFSKITGTSYTQLQAVIIVYVIIHRTIKFRLVIREWDRMTTVQKTWVGFK